MSGIQYGLGCGRKLAAFIIYDTCRRHKERKKNLRKRRTKFRLNDFINRLTIYLVKPEVIYFNSWKLRNDENRTSKQKR